MKKLNLNGKKCQKFGKMLLQKKIFHREGVEDDYNDKPLGLLWLIMMKNYLLKR